MMSAVQLKHQVLPTLLHLPLIGLNFPMRITLSMTAIDNEMECVDSDEPEPQSKSDYNSKLRIHMQHLETQFGRNTVKDFSNSYFSESILKPLVLKANFSDVNFDVQHIPSLVKDSLDEEFSSQVGSAVTEILTDKALCHYDRSTFKMANVILEIQ